MRLATPRLSLLLLIGTAPAALHAQAAPEPAHAPSSAAAEAAAEAANDIVVYGAIPPGAVVGDIPPQNQLNPADIRAYGVGTVAELLDELAAQTQSEQGRESSAPVVLVNGRRISGVNEISDLPVEAIRRIDILPEEVAIRYGYGADQKVVNVILRRRFDARVVNGTGGIATEGQGLNGRGELTYSRIRDNDRVGVTLRASAQDDLLERERGIASTATTADYSLAGNVTGLGVGGEIDPALSALAGSTVTAAAVPGTSPGLADFLATANAPAGTDLSRYRTLEPGTRTYGANAVYSHEIAPKLVGTLNGRFDYSTSEALNGLSGSTLTLPAANPYSPFAQDVTVARYLTADPLEQSVRAATGHIGASVNADRGRWRFSLTGNYDRGETRTRTDSGYDTSLLQAALDAGDAGANPFGTVPGTLYTLQTSRARAKTDSGNLQLLAQGPLLALPAGDARTSVKLGGDAMRIDSRVERAGIVSALDADRTRLQGQWSLDLPIASRSRNVLAALGNLSANVNANVARYSDHGALTGYGYGLTWGPSGAISVVASFAQDRQAPTVQQLGTPTIETPGARVYDYGRGATATVTQISGGNPGLGADTRRTWKLGVTVKPVTSLSLTASYVKSRIRNAIETLPAATAALEAAFPDRYRRDGDGDLVAIDTRAINVDREDRESLRWGIDFTRPLRSSRAPAWRGRQGAQGRVRPGDGPPPDGGAEGTPPGEGADATSGNTADARSSEGQTGRGTGSGDERGGFGGPPGSGFGGPDGGFGGGFGGGRGRGGGFGGGPGGGRIQVSLYHSWYFKDEVRLRDGVAVIDLLDGGAIGASGGRARHQVQLNAGVAKDGLGVRLTGSWQSGTRVDGSTTGSGSAASGTGELRFASFATFNLRLFADLGQRYRGQAWARGARLTLSVTNIFNQRQNVTDATGATPLRYQPAYLDPFGRTIAISFRKLFS